MNVSEAGVNLIKSFEGFPYGGRPYPDAVGVWTIGYGHTKGIGPNTKRITQRQADELLRRDLRDSYEPPVEIIAKALGLKLTQHEFDALVSAVYNLGPGILERGKTMGDALRAKSRSRIASAFLVYVKAGGQTLLGLVRRRKAERALFLKLTEASQLEGYTASEVRWIREYDRLLRANRDLGRRRVLRRVMTEQRKRIWRAAQKDGWRKANRRQRYASLLARTA